MVDEVIDEAYRENIITDEVKKVLHNDSPHTPIMYLVPKLHTCLDRPPGRPIISSIGSILQPIAIYLDVFLQKVVKTLPVCLRYTNDFLQRIATVNTLEVAWLCTFDVKSLFTNIPYEEGYEAVHQQLCQDNGLSNREIVFLMSLFDILFPKKKIRFGEQSYLQLRGTLMGSPQHQVTLISFCQR